MRNIKILIIIMLYSISYMKAQQDTIIYDYSSGNYTIQYIDEEDSLITQIFIPWNKINPSIQVNIAYNIDSNEYIYEWSIKSEENSEQNLNYFIIEFSDSNVTDRSTCGWYNKRLRKPDGKGYVNRYKWSGDQGLEPTWQVDGFVLTSPGLPSIGKSYFQGTNGSILNFSNSPPPLKILTKIKQIDGFPGGYIQRKTVVPGLVNQSESELGIIDSIYIYCDSSVTYGWIKNEATHDKYTNFLQNAKSYLENGDSISAKSELQLVLENCIADSSSSLSSEAFALLFFNTEYLISKLPEGEAYQYLKVDFKDSQGNTIQDGTLMYYDAGWKEAENNGDGTFNIETERDKVSLRMHYAGANQTVSNIQAQNNKYTFTTVNTTVQLKDSQESLLDGGTVQYYASGWKEFGDAVNGEVTKELLPKEYSFRMKYSGASLDKKQAVGENATVVFQTVNAKVQLQDSQGNLLDGGTVQYYASGWKEFGDAVNGGVTKELLPKEYSFRMKYGGAGLDKKQDIGQNDIVFFQTTNAKVQLQDSQGNLLDGGTVQYYASGWKEFGDALNGEVTKELLPKEYSCRMKYGGASIDQKQNIGENSIIVFQTVNAKVKLQDSNGNLLDGGTVQYYASGWKEFGDALNGEASKELLLKEYSFRMKYGGASIDQKQNIGENSIIVFQTVNAKVQLQDSQGNFLDGGTVEYYASGWKEFGDAVDGEVSKELLPKEYSFRMRYVGSSVDEKNDIVLNQTLVFTTVNAVIKVSDSNGQLIDGALASYYASGWKQIGNTLNGEISKELLSKNYSFRVNNSGVNQDTQQDISTNNIVEFIFD